MKPINTKVKYAAYLWKRLTRYPTTFLGVCIVAFFLIMAVIGPVVAPYGYSEQALSKRLQPPTVDNLLGTDNYGRDILSRVLVGSRDVFVVAGTATLVAAVFGLTFGLFSGYFGGIVDEIVMRIVDVMLSIPALLLAMIVLSTMGPSRINVILVVGFLYIPMVSRVVRSVVLDIKTRQFVEAAKMRGESSLYIMFREILPGVLPPLAVEASMRFSYSIFLVASLGFMGIGVQPPSPDWGLMVGEARNYFSQAKWALFSPAAAIALLVVGVGFMSDGLRRMLLPKGILK